MPGNRFLDRAPPREAIDKRALPPARQCAGTERTSGTGRDEARLIPLRASHDARVTLCALYLAYPWERSHAILRSPLIQSSASALLVKPLISRCSLSG